MTCIYNNEVKNIYERNLIHNIINTPKRVRNINTHYSPILHGCMNTRKNRARFRKNCILLDSGCSSTILMRRLVNQLGLEEDSPIQWSTQAGNITTTMKDKLDLTLPTLSATNVMTSNFHVDESAKGRYDIILGQYILT